MSNLACRTRADGITERTRSEIRKSSRSNCRIGIKLVATNRIKPPNVDQAGLEATDSGFNLLQRLVSERPMALQDLGPVYASLVAFLEDDMPQADRPIIEAMLDQLESCSAAVSPSIGTLAARLAPLLNESRGSQTMGTLLARLDRLTQSEIGPEGDGVIVSLIERLMDRRIASSWAADVVVRIVERLADRALPVRLVHRALDLLGALLWHQEVYGGELGTGCEQRLREVFEKLRQRLPAHSAEGWMGD